MMTKEEYTKEEFYKNFIGMQKLSGQGTSGIVKVQGFRGEETILQKSARFSVKTILKQK